MKDDENDFDLHKLLKRRAYDHALVATFTFGTRFFEEYVLERFKAFHGKGNLTVFLDRGQYEEIIEAAASGDGWVPKLANRRYLLHPVEVPGVFHPKVFLFTAGNRGLLVIGSANFSQDGLGGNAELVSVFEFEEGKDEETQPLFQSAFRFFEKLSGRWRGKEATSNVDEVRRSSPWLIEPLDAPTSEALPVFLHNLDEPLWPRIAGGLGPVDEISLVSRFFDSSPAILDKISEGLGEPKLRIHTQPKRGTLTPEWLDHPFAKDKRLGIRLCEYGDGEHIQPLHGKAYALRSGRQTTLAVGSANFSTAALLRSADSGNVEVMLLYPPTATGSLEPAELFDPRNSAREVTHREQIVLPDDAETGPVHRAKSFDHVLEEARMEEGNLVLVSSATGPRLGCRLSQANVASVVLPVEAFRHGSAQLSPPPKWTRRLSESPTVAQLVRCDDESSEPVSNPVLVAALFGPDSGSNTRRARRLREAAESPQRFMGVLRELCEGDDEAALLSFLSNCNIPFDLALRAFRPTGRRLSSSTDPPMEFGHLGSRNLRHFEQIHDAAMAFTRRHRRRLSRHIENGTVRGFPNFLHILETLILLLVSQIERAREGLLAEPETTLSANDWREFRKHLSEYYQEIERLLALTVHEYLPVLHKQESPTTLGENFGDAPEAILKTCSRALAARREIAKSLETRVYVETERGTTERARFFHTLLEDEKWKHYLQNLKRLAQEWRSGVAA